MRSTSPRTCYAFPRRVGVEHPIKGGLVRGRVLLAGEVGDIEFANASRIVQRPTLRAHAEGDRGTPKSRISYPRVRARLAHGSRKSAILNCASHIGGRSNIADFSEPSTHRLGT